MKKIILSFAVLTSLTSLNVLADDYASPEQSASPQHQQREQKSITRAEFTKHAEERFAKLDTNGDAVLSPEERRAGHQKMRENFKQRHEARKERRGQPEQGQ